MKMQRNWSRFIRFIAKEDGKTYYGSPKDSSLDVGVAIHRGNKVAAYLLSGNDLPYDGMIDYEKVLHVDTLLSPLPRESIGGVIRCLGINFRKHVEEANMTIADVPVMFMKPYTSLSGPGLLSVPRFVHAASVPQLDYETEMAVILDRETKDIKPENVMDHVLGFTSANDISARFEQLRQSQWNFGKGIDNACPIGPCIASPESFDPLNTNFEGRLNGKVMQKSNTSDHIFNFKAAVSYLSSGTTLPRGSIILLGTPNGVGWFREPKVILQNDDIFEVSHEGPIGTLVNTIKYA